jgi:hypothetical protein
LPREGDDLRHFAEVTGIFGRASATERPIPHGVRRQGIKGCGIPRSIEGTETSSPPPRHVRSVMDPTPVGHLAPGLVLDFLAWRNGCPGT